MTILWCHWALAATCWTSTVTIKDGPAVGSAETLTEVLEEALAYVETNALHRDRVNWQQVRTITTARLQKNPTEEELHESIRWVLRQLDDGHSFFMTPEQTRAWKAPPASEQATGEEAADPTPAPLPEGELMEEEIGYVRIPQCGSFNPEFLETYAQTLQDLICQIDAEVPIGWVVDLRGNGGGNCWPMLAGISSVLGEGVVGSFQNAQRDSRWGTTAGSAWEGDPEQVLTEVSRPCELAEPMPWVAVLTDQRTASSGEVVTVAFRARPRCRSFGMPTAGLSTANENYELSDGSTMLVTTAVYADRRGVAYGATIAPDEVFEERELGSNEDGEDLVLERAMQWLRESYDAE